MNRLVLLVAATVLVAPVQALAPASRPRPVEVSREANRLLIDRTPTPLLFARGLVAPEEYDTYRATGFNTLVFDVTDASEEAVAELDARVRGAQAQEFYILLALRPARLPPASPESEAYRDAVREFVRAVGKLRALSRLVAWVVEAAPSDRLPEFDADFIRHLVVVYRSLEALNAAWGTEFIHWRQATPAVATALDADKPGQIGRAVLDLARFRRRVYRNVLSIWANELRVVDPVHPLFAGAVRDFRAIISVPGEYAGIVTELQPHLIGGDAVTHNVHGVDMARRGGRMAPLPILSTRALPGQLTNWMRHAALHGACGIGFDSWLDLIVNEPRRRAIAAAVDALVADGVLPVRPVVSLAVLYEPFHPGPGVRVRGSYGYLPNIYPGPATLFAALGRGTRVGLVDFLSEEDVARVNLDTYGAILAPQAYTLSVRTRQALIAFVGRGGRLMADLGFGCYEAGGLVSQMPADLRELFGVPRPVTVDERPVALWTWGNPAFPELGEGQPARGMGPDNQPFAGPIAYTALSDPGRLVLGGEAFEVVFTGVVLSPPRGDGYALFGMTWLWQYWLPGDRVFDALHTHLVTDRARGLVVYPASFVSDVVFVQLSDDRVALWNPGGEGVELTLRGPRVYQCPLLLQEVPPTGQTTQHLTFPGQRVWVATPLPLDLVAETPARAEVLAYGPDRIHLKLYGTGAAMQWSAEGWRASRGQYTRFHVAIRDGAYPVTVDSLHRMTWRRRRGADWEHAEVRADGRVLRHDFRARNGELIIEPLSADE